MRRIVLALPPYFPHGGEDWPQYRRRMAERLEPIRREAARRLGLDLSPLFAANALHGAASDEALCELRRGTLGTEVSLVEWGDLLPAAQMDDVVLEIGLTTAFEPSRALSGHGVTVAVLDSGIDARHPYLAVADAVSTCPEPTSVPGLHGTHCAGVIASRSIEHPGIAPSVRLLDVKVADAGGNTSPGWLAQGIDEALDRGADVLSISFGLNRFPRNSLDGHGWICDDGRCVLCRAVDHATACGALVVAAVGNGHLRAQALRREGLSLSPGIELLCPGQARGALAVGALDKAPFAGRLYPRSSRGLAGHGALKPDLVAPGVDVLSTVPIPVGDDSMSPGRLFGFGSGTSVATAVVAGALALLVERRRAQGLPCSPAEIRHEVLGRCVRPVDATRVSNGGGAGVLDLSRLSRSYSSDLSAVSLTA
jgi:serine protease AprX